MRIHRTKLQLTTDDSSRSLELTIEAEFIIRRGQPARLPDLRSPGEPGWPDEVEVTQIRLVHDAVVWPCPMWLTSFIHESLDQDTMLEAASD